MAQAVLLLLCSAPIAKRSACEQATKPSPTAATEHRARSELDRSAHGSDFESMRIYV